MTVASLSVEVSGPTDIVIFACIGSALDAKGSEAKIARQEIDAKPHLVRSLCERSNGRMGVESLSPREFLLSSQWVLPAERRDDISSFT